MSLQKIREQLDDIDEQILSLYERRMELCEQVGKDKLRTGKKVYDRKREEEKLAVLSEKASNERNKKGIRELFEQIMSMSRKLQYQILGENGVYGKTAFIQLKELESRNARLVFQGTDVRKLIMINVFLAVCVWFPVRLVQFPTNHRYSSWRER